MRVLHFAPISQNKASGISFSVPNLIKGQNMGKSSCFCTADLYNIQEERRLSKLRLREYDVVVLHSFFHLVYIQLLFRLPKNARLIVCPRGAFSSKNHFDLKKRIYAFLFFSLMRIRTNDWSIHFLTKREQKSSRYRGKNDFVLGNCIESKESKTINIKKKFDAKTIIYIGRFSSHIKGLDSLFDLLIKYQKEIRHTGYNIHLYGPESFDKEVLKKIKTKENLDFVKFFSPVFGNDKQHVLESSTFHILNSRSEGYPMSVLESLNLYTPQILSPGTNLLEDMIERKFGFELDETVIESVSKLSLADYDELCQNSKAYSELHDCEIIGKRSLLLYK